MFQMLVRNISVSLHQIRPMCSQNDTPCESKLAGSVSSTISQTSCSGCDAAPLPVSDNGTHCTCRTGRTEQM